MSIGAVAEKRPLSNRQRKELRRRIKAEQASAPKAAKPAPETYEAPNVKTADDVVIPGLSGRGATLRTDTLWKLYNTGKLNPVQYSAGVDYLRVVEAYFANTPGMAKLGEEAGQVGGNVDPINRYLKARPMRLGYVPTQRPRRPSSCRAHGDGWTNSRLDGMGQFGKVAALVKALPVDHRRAICLLIIDPSAPNRPPLTLDRATQLMFTYSDSRLRGRVASWLGHALDVVDLELHHLLAA